jgi:hypothetical protein
VCVESKVGGDGTGFVSPFFSLTLPYCATIPSTRALSSSRMLSAVALPSMIKGPLPAPLPLLPSLAIVFVVVSPPEKASSSRS